MPTHKVNLTEELDQLIAAKVSSGRYQNASEVVRAALRSLENDERRCEVKLDTLRAALDEGEQSGIAEDYSLEGVLVELGSGCRP